MRANVTRAAEGFNCCCLTADEILGLQDAGIISENENFELIEGEIVSMLARPPVQELVALRGSDAALTFAARPDFSVRLASI
jgi:hypothetical protein